MRTRTSRIRVLASALAAGALVSSCSAAASEPDDRLQVAAGFYPLEYLADEIGKDLVTVDGLTPPGVEPHDVELSSRQAVAVREADVVLRLEGLQPSVDAAVRAGSSDVVLDAASVPSVAAHRETDRGSALHPADDPHFWLNPALMADVALAVGTTLAEADPANADVYERRAEALAADLQDLDGQYADGLAECERRAIVTAHEAFGYIAERYDLEPVALSGLNPEAEPSPARLREVREAIDEGGITTIFTEPLVEPKVAQTLAGELGITTTVLDPLESQADAKADYRAVMTRNLGVLRDALGCA